MLSRVAILSGQTSKSLLATCLRATSTSAVNTQVAKTDEKSSEVTFSRPVRQEPGKVRMGFVPEEWFQFFYKKTGVTGPYTFAFTLSTYLVSKEIYVLEHEFYNGLSFLIMWVVGIKMFGPKLAAYLDKEVDEYEKAWNQSRVDQKEALSEQIADEEKAQWSMEGQNILVEAKRENVALQLEANYRDRIMNVYYEVKKRLDYQVEKQNIERRITQKNLVDYVVAKVMSSITPDQEKQNINKCISDLALLSKA
ncbi:ATP synthase subunit b, mitochondrial [Diorhabda sublineata]|uniref:ATP synthase subunit b, mitochondrial n=1 Tax=Diorhabda sublineata TaxID=1163346 RepID=UPI0024E084C5|nr:ATP synthase subunit b, mitochondrial [Diorhabda sublineata]